MSQPLIVLTGATGNLGSGLVPELLSRNFGLALLVRAKTDREAAKRIEAATSSHSVRVYASDLTKPMLGLRASDFRSLSRSVDGILHAAASTQFNHSLEESRHYNVDTTKNMLSFAKECSRLSSFGYISTVYIAGKRVGRIHEDEFEHGEGFINTYEQTKYEAEELVRKEQNMIPTIILRPSLIISKNIRREGPVNAVSLGLFLAKRGLLPILPGSKKNKVDLIRVDEAARAIIDLFQESLTQEVISGDTYHIASGDDAIIMNDVVGVIEKKIQRDLSIDFCGGIENFDEKLKEITKTRPDIWAVYKKIETFVTDLAYPKIFDTQNTYSILKRTLVSEKILDDLNGILR